MTLANKVEWKEIEHSWRKKISQATLSIYEIGGGRGGDEEKKRERERERAVS